MSLARTAGLVILAALTAVEGCTPSRSDPLAPSLTSFNHDTVFPIYVGHHTGIDCNECHGAFTTFTKFDCLGCHTQMETDPIHGASDPMMAGTMDPTMASSTSDPTMAGSTTDPTTVGSTTDPMTAGTMDQMMATEPMMLSTAVPGYSYDSAACYRCHPTGDCHAM